MTPSVLYRDSIPQLTVETIDRFWRKVDTKPGNGPNGDCWTWTGSADKLGYGRLTIRPYRFLAHRFAWLLEHGILWDDLEILHQCDFPPCIRPDHLREGTHKENMHDCKSKGRNRSGYVYGELVGNHKLSAAQVREIRSIYGDVRRGYANIAKQYGVSDVLIGAILRKQIWVNDNDIVIQERPIKIKGKGNTAKREVVEQPDDPSYRLIPLTQGQYALVDTADYEWLMQWSWYAHWSEKSKSFYAVRNSRANEGNPQMIRMHRMIMGIGYGDERTVDHIDPAMTLDNRRSNLRIATQAEQSRNQSTKITNTTGYKGVTVFKDRNKYASQIGVNKEKIHLVQSDDPKIAYAAYCEAANKYHGKFARLA